MEDLQPISDAEQDSFCVELAKRLNMQRKQDHLCDVTLLTKDDKEFKAHRNVLTAASPFFCKLLQSDMKENREGIVRFEEISGAIMEDVLEFMYTGSVEVTQENSMELIAAANYLLIPGLKKLSGRLLERQMGKSNCISTFYFAEMYECDELITNSREFILANFASVAEMDEFLNLEAKEVERWVSSEEISVAVEADVFKIVLKWIEENKSERKASFEQLFRHVRLGVLSRDFLLDVVTNELVKENTDCFNLISKAIEVTGFASAENIPKSPRRGLETRVIVARGGKYTFCYLPEKDEWKRLADGLSEREQQTQMFNFRDQLHAFSFIVEAERYDPVVNAWRSFDLSAKTTPFSMTFPKLAVVRGEIYSIEAKSYMICTVKRYDVERRSWQTLLSSREGCRDESCVVAAGNHLYVCGGTMADRCRAAAERFDTVEIKWEKIADMQQNREGAFGAATKGKIFVAGGKDMQLCLQTCEMFNILTNEWQLDRKSTRLNSSHT